MTFNEEFQGILNCSLFWYDISNSLRKIRQTQANLISNNVSDGTPVQLESWTTYQRFLVKQFTVFKKSVCRFPKRRVILWINWNVTFSHFFKLKCFFQFFSSFITYDVSYMCRSSGLGLQVILFSTNHTGIDTTVLDVCKREYPEQQHNWVSCRNVCPTKSWSPWVLRSLFFRHWRIH